MRTWIGLLVFFLAIPGWTGGKEIRLPGGSIEYLAYEAQGRALLLWVASERGVSQAERHAAEALAKQGVEVWLFDLPGALFLPPVPGSLDGVGAEIMQTVLRQANQDGRELYVYAVGRGAVPVLKGLEASPELRASLLLMHPNFYARAEALEGADYLIFRQLQGVKILILQPRRSAATPWVDGQLVALANAGAQTGLRMLERLREGFWVREDANAYELQTAAQLADLVMNWMGRVRK